MNSPLLRGVISGLSISPDAAAPYLEYTKVRYPIGGGAGLVFGLRPRRLIGCSSTEVMRDADHRLSSN